MFVVLLHDCAAFMDKGEYFILPPSHFFGVPFLEKGDLIFGNVASIVGKEQKNSFPNMEATFPKMRSSFSKNEIFLFQK